LLFARASAALSPAARRVLREHQRAETVSPHSLRHTCAVARLSAFVESGMEMKLALQLLRSFFGWTPASNMPLHYSRSMFEDRLRSFWRGKLDDRTEFVRQLALLGARGGLHPGAQTISETEEVM
jgi:integrase